MKWKISPSHLSGTIAIPPSKSHTIRALLVAALAHGTSAIRHPLLEGDGASAIGAAKSLGAKVEFKGVDLFITGTGQNYDAGEALFAMGNSGTSTNLFSSAASLGHRQRTFDGDNSLRSRPFRPLLTALMQLGAQVQFAAETRDLPFTICGPIKGGKVTVNGISSQFVSSLLFTCPLLLQDTEIIVENLHERPYVEMTLWWLKKQGINFSHNNDLTHFWIPGKQSYTAFDMAIPSDFSGATFAASAAAITSATLSLTGLDFSDPQGDKEVFEVLRQFGATVTISSGTTLVAGPASLTGRTIDLNTMPDALPALSVVACAAAGVTEFVNVAQARIKETDRITVMREELSKMGAQITERDDGLTIRKSTLKGTLVNGHDDHRVVMALALAGMIAVGETIIDTAEAATVTYPTFVDDFRAIGATIEVID